jgi:serine protease Do
MKKRFLALALLLALCIGVLSSCALLDGQGLLSGGEGGDTVINVEGGDNYDITIESNDNKSLLAASKALLSSVSVTTESSAGSGVIYKLDKEKGDAYIITNFHVVHKSNTNSISDRISVYLYGMEAADYAIPATYVGGSINYDIAVLKVTASKVLMRSNAAAVSVANSDEVAILETVIAIGNPEAEGISATVGCINVESENIYVEFQVQNSTRRVSLRVMRTDAAVNSGNSGGGLFNDKGELVGIVNAKSSDTLTDNIGYAIPSNVARAIADNIIHYCDGSTKTSVYRCMMGVTVGVKEMYTEYDKTTGKVYKRETVMVAEVDGAGVAYTRLKAGDVINSITIDGVTHKVTRTYHLVDTMLDARVGSQVTINVTRDGASVDVEVPITENTLTEY